MLRPGAPAWLLRLLGSGEANPALPRALHASWIGHEELQCYAGATAAELAGETNRGSARGDVATVPVADYDEAARRLVDGDVGAWVGEWAVLLPTCQIGRATCRHDADRLALSSANRFAIAIRSDVTLRRNPVQAALSAILRSRELEVMAVRWFGSAGHAQVPLIQSHNPTDRAHSP